MTSYRYPLIISRSDLLKLKEMIAREHWHDELDASLSYAMENDSGLDDKDLVVLDINDRQSIFLRRWVNGEWWNGHIVPPKSNDEAALKRRVGHAYRKCISRIMGLY